MFVEFDLVVNGNPEAFFAGLSKWYVEMFRFWWSSKLIRIFLCGNVKPGRASMILELETIHKQGGH